MWSGLICLVSFIWGVAGVPLWSDASSCGMRNTPVAVVGLLVLLSGVGGLGYVGQQSAANR
mgnify:CR=1 FL=1